MYNYITEAAGMRDELEEVVWSHFEKVVAPEAAKYQIHDPDQHQTIAKQPKVLMFDHEDNAVIHVFVT